MEQPNGTFKRRNAGGRALVDTSEDPGLRGRAFVDALRSLDTTGRCPLLSKETTEWSELLGAVRNFRTDGSCSRAARSCRELSGAFELPAAVEELPGTAQDLLAAVGNCSGAAGNCLVSAWGLPGAIGRCQELSRSCRKGPASCQRAAGRCRELSGSCQELPRSC